jgi:hypothetical protein
MSHCRFINTKSDLKDCLRNFWEIGSIDEHQARQQLVKIAKSIVEEYESDPEQVDGKFIDEDEDENN